MFFHSGVPSAIIDLRRGTGKGATRADRSAEEGGAREETGVFPPSSFGERGRKEKGRGNGTCFAGVSPRDGPLGRQKTEGEKRSGVRSSVL